MKFTLELLVVMTIIALLAPWADARHSQVVTARHESACETQRIVEMRNAVLAATILCREVITPKDFKSFVAANLSRIKAANKTSIAYHVRRFGSRRRLDTLDSKVMNENAKLASANPAAFCEGLRPLKALLKTKTIDELLKTQTYLAVPACD